MQGAQLALADPRSFHSLISPGHPTRKPRLSQSSRKPAIAGTEFQIDSLDTGWSSGRMSLTDGASVELNLAKPGENVFKVFVFDARGGRIPLDQDKIVISRTAASIDASLLLTP